MEKNPKKKKEIKMMIYYIIKIIQKFIKEDIEDNSFVILLMNFIIEFSILFMKKKTLIFIIQMLTNRNFT